MLSGVFLPVLLQRLNLVVWLGIRARPTTHQSARFKAFEAKFLQMLGMKEKPRITKNVVVPQYMLDLYNSRSKDPEYISTNLVFKDFATTANTVRSFYHKGN